MSTPSSKLGRRRFLITTGAALAAASTAGALATGCGAGAPATPPGPQDTGMTVAQLAVGTFMVPSGADYILARDAQGIYAYSNRCTHQGCELPSPTASGPSVCPCHGAQFDANGNNLAGPHGGGPVADLEHYKVTFVGTGPSAQIVVDTSMPEPDRTARAVPPDTTGA